VTFEGASVKLERRFDVTTCKGTVLAIDDDPAVLDTLAGTLGHLGYDVLQSTDGVEGYRLAVSHQPDVILLDVVMPGPDGFEVCGMLKGNPDTKLIPVVFLTAHGSRETRIKGLDAGATDFLGKPSDLAELEARVRNLVAFRHLTLDFATAEEMIFTLAKLMEARDRDTGDHCARLAELSVKLGRRLGLDDELLKALERGSYLHDIGKIGVPDAVLLKPAQLEPDEWEIVRRHPEIGYEICRPLRSLEPALPLIRHHHERCDGSGYPDGLEREQIPLVARVFQVVDVYDSLVNERPYRRPLPVEKAIEILLDETGRGYWDENIVAEFVAMVSESAQTTDVDAHAT
jgi:putative two-component system response regulator